MIRRLLRAFRQVTGRNIAGRHLEVRNDDRFIVSYPRSGNTWVRFLVANLTTAEEVSFQNIERIVPDIYQNETRALRRLGSPRILKSHEAFDPRYPIVLYLVRDPRDVCLSYRAYLRKQGWPASNYPLDHFVGLFVKGSLPGGYGSWGENVGSWLGARKTDENFLLMRYEDLLSDTLMNASSMARFLMVDSAELSVRRAVEASSLERMKALEDQQANLWRPIRGSDPQVRFIRGRGAGAWHESLTESLSERIWEAWGSLMDSLGYSRGPVQMPRESSPG